MNPNASRLLIASALAGGFLPFERLLFSPENDPAGGGGGGGGGGDKPPPAPTPKYTDEQVNALIAKERRAAEEKAAKTLTDAKAETDKQIAELNEKIELAGKSAAEQQKIQAEKAAQKLANDKAAAEAATKAANEKAASMETRLKTTVQKQQLGAALTAAKVFPGAAEYAVEALLREATDLDVDAETYAIKALTIDGVRYSELAKAATAFLEKRPFFVSAPGGGAGTQTPNGGLPATAPLKDRAAAEFGRIAGQLGAIPKPPT